ncbi:MAG: hypothetical protein ABI693_31310, partial [Bryobacteraceae bacterium]
MTAATLAIVVSQAILFIAMSYFGPMEFIHLVISAVIVLTAFGAVAAVYKITVLLFTFNQEISTEVDGKFVSQQQAPELWRLVAQTAAAVGTAPPQNIVVGTNATFFVTETKVKTEQGFAAGRTLYLSLPLCRILSKSELGSVIA